MHRALTFALVIVLLCVPSAAAPRISWNKIRYIGGTVNLKTSPYDWNTTLTIDQDAIVITIAPAKAFVGQQTLRIKPSEVTSLSYGLGAWRRVGEVTGAQLPAKPPSLFGLMNEYRVTGIIYQTADGKHGALLLRSDSSSQFLFALQNATGKVVEGPP